MIPYGEVLLDETLKLMKGSEKMSFKFMDDLLSGKAALISKQNIHSQTNF